MHPSTAPTGMLKTLSLAIELRFYAVTCTNIETSIGCKLINSIISLKTLMKKTITITSIILAIAAIIAVFELLPAVEYARWHIPTNITDNKACGCTCILNSRPWYSTFNYWFWLWFAGIPLTIFQIKPSHGILKKSVIVITAIATCYIIMNLAIHLMWDIRSAPFTVSSSPNVPDQVTWDMVECANTSDGASLAFTLLFGWLYATIYTGWWLIAWKRYHIKYTKTITDDYEYDILSKIVVGISVVLPLIPITYTAFILFGGLVAWILDILGLLNPILSLIH
jgi:hypothetical protein